MDPSQGQIPSLRSEEFQVLEDSAFLLTKSAVLDKARQLLLACQARLETAMEHPLPYLPGTISIKNTKVSRGENYRGLPYLVLDCPRSFAGGNIFTYRTMLWWGHEFSATLHLQGTYLQEALPAIREHLSQGALKNYYFCINDTPWEYHFGEDNYRLIGQTQPHELPAGSRPFIKIAQKWPLQTWEALPERVSDNWHTLCSLLYS